MNNVTWNYRVYEHTPELDNADEVFCTFVVEFHDEDGGILSYSNPREPAYPGGDSLEDLRADLAKFMGALASDVLHGTDLPGHPEYVDPSEPVPDELVTETDNVVDGAPVPSDPSIQPPDLSEPPVESEDVADNEGEVVGPDPDVAHDNPDEPPTVAVDELGTPVYDDSTNPEHGGEA